MAENIQSLQSRLLHKYPWIAEKSRESSSDINNRRGTAVGNKDDVDTTDPMIKATAGSVGELISQ